MCESDEQFFVEFFIVFFCWFACSSVLIEFLTSKMFRVYLMLCAAPWLAQAAITLTGKRCGTKMCSLAEYCSSFHNQCEHCATVCTRTEHNFDQAICESQCQGKSLRDGVWLCHWLYRLFLDYLHDIRFAKASDYAGLFVFFILFETESRDLLIDWLIVIDTIAMRFVMHERGISTSRHWGVSLGV